MKHFAALTSLRRAQLMLHRGDKDLDAARSPLSQASTAAVAHGNGAVERQAAAALAGPGAG